MDNLLVVQSSKDLHEYAALRLWAKTFFDFQQNRIRLENRLRTDESLAEIFGEELYSAKAKEREMDRYMMKQYKATVPQNIREWQEETRNLGVHTFALFMGYLGHPRIAIPHHWHKEKGKKSVPVADEPYLRSISELWQYCGHGGEKVVFRGMTQADICRNGVPALKAILHRISESLIREPGSDVNEVLEDFSVPSILSTKPRQSTTGRTFVAQSTPCTKPKSRTTARQNNGRAGSPSSPTTRNDESTEATVAWPYRTIYNNRRIETMDRVHAKSCAPCGPSGDPAEPGSPWSKKHAHFDALRIVGKEVLRDLWIVATLEPPKKRMFVERKRT